ncbi:MAG: hypothetical protein A2X86_18750 [Bdellovibrionales bacterium GWA2_49_15]|nr:MAG: hypothetical protein A2X86_18750 [Bdellovibrionales bacterium GWA2_49_15]HAZ14266.1 hypothetical protein [Bdellovibrionales bacterium]
MICKILFVIILCLFEISIAVAKDTKESFDHWRASFELRALKNGISFNILDLVFKNIKADESIIRKDENQWPPKDVAYLELMKNWLGPSTSGGLDRIKQGKILLKKHSVLLEQVENKYGVDRNIIVAIWGIESRYGEINGQNDIIRSLATLAWEGRRRAFFEKELLASLRMLQGGYITHDNFKGSWAGAFGQCQFMPSNFFYYAQDGDGDGRKDLVGSLPDVFSSIAFYFKKSRWKRGAPVARILWDNKKAGRPPLKKVNLGIKGAPELVLMKNAQSVMRWNRSHIFILKVQVLLEGFGRSG